MASRKPDEDRASGTFAAATRVDIDLLTGNLKLAKTFSYS
jgi:hypothetical protein